MKTLIKTVMGIAILGSLATAGNVISWVAPYFMSQTKNTLNQNFDGVGMKDGLTHLALQFWVPNGAQASLANRYGNITATDIQFFTDWGDQNNVKTLLCVYNGENGWDWNLAVNSFANNRSAFVQSLVSQVAQYNLDGVELDLEGPGADNSQKANFLAFLSELRSALPADKDITVATFAYIWNAPNSSWWNDMLPYVDVITSMGYEEIGKNALGWASYATQKSLLSDPSKLALGMPTYKESWQGNTAQEQVDWVVNNGTVGVAIWDAALSNNGTASAQWQSGAMWNKLASVVGNTVVPTSSEANTSSSSSSSSSSTTTSCERTLVPGYQFNLASGSNSLAGYQENNYVSQGGPFSAGDQVLPQGAPCNQAITLDAAADTWNLYTTSNWTGSTQNAVYLEKITGTVISSSNQLISSSIAASSSAEVVLALCGDYPNYTSGTNYSTGDVVNYQQAIYSAKRKTNKVPTNNVWTYVETCTDLINQSSIPLSSSEAVLSSIAASSSTEDPCNGYSEFVAGVTNPSTGQEYTYGGFLWKAKNNPGSWETPKEGWFWTKSATCGAKIVLSSIAASSSIPLSSSETVLSSIAPSSSIPLSSSETILSSIAPSSSIPLSSSETILSSIAASSSIEDICSGYPEFIGGVTAPSSGNIYTYNGSLWEAKNNPGTWESPAEGWFWTEVGICGESPASSVLQSSIAASSITTQSSTPLSSSVEIASSSSATTGNCSGYTEWSTITTWANFLQGDTFTYNGLVSTCQAHPAYCYGSAGEGFGNSYWSEPITCMDALLKVGARSNEITAVDGSISKAYLHKNTLIMPSAQNFKVTIFEMTGQLIFSKSVSMGTKLELPLNTTKTYIINVEHSNGSHSIKYLGQ
jgi:hypothetical protein